MEIFCLMLYFIGILITLYLIIKHKLELNPGEFGMVEFVAAFLWPLIILGILLQLIIRSIIYLVR